MTENTIIETDENKDSEKAPKTSPDRRTFCKKSCKKRLCPLAVAVSVGALVVIVSLLISLVSVYSRLDAMKDIHRAIYDKSQKIEVAGKGEWIETYLHPIGTVRFPVLDGVPKSTYKDENFVTDENGYRKYYVDGELCSYVGVDVSEHNEIIDWDKVKASGVDFVMVRLGGRGYGDEGTLYADDSYMQNIRGAKKAGLSVGAYFFSQARTVDEAREEAEYAVSLLKGESLDYPIAFDWEKLAVEGGTRIDSVSGDMLTDMARAFSDKIKDCGYEPMIYTGTTLAYFMYDLRQICDIDMWYAYYPPENDPPRMYYNYMMWQYTSDGIVDGISGGVDINICMKNYN